MKLWMPLIATQTGAEVYARRLARGLEEKGHSVTLDVVPHHYQYLPWAAPLRVPNGTDVTIANSWSAAAFAGPAPLVTIVHHVVHDPALSEHKTLAQRVFHRCFVKPMELAAIRRSAMVIAVSETTARAVRRHLCDVSVRTVLNGVDTAYFTPGEAAPPHDPGRPMRLLFVGKPSHRKAFDTVAEIVSLLGERCEFTCIGSSPERGLALPPGRYPGRVTRDELREAYRAADFLLMPSRLEGFGYAAAEALACGLPVACTSGGAVAEITDPPNCGIAATERDAGLFADLLLAAWHDRSAYAAMCRNARTHAVLQLDERRWLADMESCLMQAGVTGRPVATDNRSDESVT